MNRNRSSKYSSIFTYLLVMSIHCFAQISLVRWSPNGAYLFVAHPDGGFRVWDTSKWGVAKWATMSARWHAERPVVVCEFISVLCRDDEFICMFYGGMRVSYALWWNKVCIGCN